MQPDGMFGRYFGDFVQRIERSDAGAANRSDDGAGLHARVQVILDLLCQRFCRHGARKRVHVYHAQIAATEAGQ